MIHVKQEFLNQYIATSTILKYLSERLKYLLNIYFNLWSSPIVTPSSGLFCPMNLIVL